MRLKNVLSLVIVLFISIHTTIGQQVNLQKQKAPKMAEVTDSELETFATIRGEVQAMSKQLNADVMQMIQAQGMDLKRYQKIAKAKQSGQEVQYNEGEKEIFNSIQDTIKQKRKGMQADFQELFQKHSMKRMRYLQLRKALQSDKELLMRYKKLQQQK
jgi:hypothetical protein